MNKYIKLFMSSMIFTASLSASAGVVNILTEDFESGSLSNWTGKYGGPTSGQIVADPLDLSNNVLSFNAIVGGGDIFSIDTVATTSTYTLSFDYMGSGVNGGGDGFIGISQGLPGHHTWLFGNSWGSVANLIDDGVWRSYTTTFANPYNTSVHLMLEDFRPTARNAFFDNISLADTATIAVPEASMLSLFGLGLLGLGLARRRG
jgi:hypothetical protein